MYKLLYVSSTRREFPARELQDILNKARANNARLDVTGLLLYIDGGFLQILEGDENIVRELYDSIAKDPRHWDPKVLLEQDGPRNFEAWSMGFKALSVDDEASGVLAITRDAIGGLIAPGGAAKVLQILINTFRDVQGA